MQLIRGWPCVALAAGAATVVAACGASGASTSASRGGSQAAAVASGSPIAVPWADQPFQPYTPSPLPAPTVTPAPLCRLQDLTEQPVTTEETMGNEAIVFSFTNHGAQPCLVGGYPRVVLSQPGEATLIPSRGGFWDQFPASSDLPRGATATFSVGFALGCGKTGGTQHVYKHFVVTLPGGWTFAETLTGTAPYSSGTPLGVFALCGVTLSELSGPFVPPVYPRDPLAGLTATIHAPVTVEAGTTITYFITLANPSAVAMALVPCRGYLQTLDHTKTPAFAYELNCAAALPIAPLGSESFVMKMPMFDASPGVHTVCWSLDLASTSRPPTCATVRVTT